MKARIDWASERKHSEFITIRTLKDILDLIHKYKYRVIVSQVSRDDEVELDPEGELRVLIYDSYIE